MRLAMVDRPTIKAVDSNRDRGAGLSDALIA